MAQYKIPYQNLNFNLPDEGQVFRTDPNQGEEGVLMRRSGSFVRLNKKQYKGDYNALRPLTITGEMEQAMGQLRGGGQRIIEGTPQDFLNPQVKRGEIFNQNISPINPHQTDILSNLSGAVRTATGKPQAGAYSGNILNAKAPIIPAQTPQTRTLPPVDTPLGSPERTRQLLMRGDVLGQEASKQTGKPYTPVSPIKQEITNRAGGSPIDTLVSKMTGATIPATPATAEYSPLPAEGPETKAQADLKTVRGEREKVIGTYDEEIKKTQNLLADLDARIRGGLNREEARKAPMEIITGRQAEIERQNAADRQTTVDLLQNIQSGRAMNLEALDRQEKDILTDLGLAEKAEQRPLQNLLKDIDVRSKLKDLAAKDFPDLITPATFNDEGDMTMVFKDLTTQTIKGIGKETNVSNIKSVDVGNDKIIYGIKNNKVVPLGTIAGGGKKEGNEEKPLSILDVKRYNEEYPEAGVVAGDTQTIADKKVLELSKPREFTDEDFRITFRDLKTQNTSYEKVLSDLKNNSIISNKERGELLLKEIYGKKEKQPITEKQSIKEIYGKKEKQPITEKQSIDVSFTSFFNRLFGK